MNRILLMPAILAALAINSTVFCAESSSAGSNLGNVKGGDFAKAQDIIKKKCTQCHSTAKIDAALKSGKEMVLIQKQMEKRGVKLTTSEREVLGIFWSQNPLKK